MAVFFFIELCSCFAVGLLAAAFGRIPRLYQNKYSKNSLDFKKYLCYTRNKRSNNDATRVRSCRGDGRTEFL